MAIEIQNSCIVLLLKGDKPTQFGPLNLRQGITLLPQRRSKTRLSYFTKIFFTTRRRITWQKLIKFINKFLNWLNDENYTIMDKKITDEELHQTLKEMAKDKIIRPDGWPSDFFLHYFELMGLDLVHMAEAVRKSGHISGVINSTFLTFIPKMAFLVNGIPCQWGARKFLQNEQGVETRL